jgi:hypothetical protein
MELKKHTRHKDSTQNSCCQNHLRQIQGKSLFSPCDDKKKKKFFLPFDKLVSTNYIVPESDQDSR